MRILSRVFRGMLLIATLVFAGVSPSFAADPQADCLAAGWLWDSDNQVCCWHYYVDDNKTSICINKDNFNNYFNTLNCKYNEKALYIDASTGKPACCPDGTQPNDATHKCDCENGGVLNTLTGKCELFMIRKSLLCDDWNKENNDTFGFFFNYLLGKLNSLSDYKSKYTCSQVITEMNRIGLSGVVTGVEGSCICKCEDPMLSFDPSAAEACVDGDPSECQNVCVDASDGQYSPCPAGQQKFLDDNTWKCCIFYDPLSGTCIDTDADWRRYVTETLRYESGGGYVNAEGIPVECPVDENIGTNRETGRCICNAGGWFDVTTGTCMQQLHVRHTPQRGVGSQIDYNYTQTWNGMPASQTPNGYLDTFFHQVYNANGTYVYTSLPANTPASTPYVYTDTGSFAGKVNSFYYVTLTFMGNGGTFSGQTSALKSIRVGQYSVNAPTPTKTGNSLQGWFTAASGGSQVASNALTDVTSNTIYYAHWTPNISGAITLDASKYHTSSGDSGTNITLTTNVSPTTVYSKYGVNLYTGSGATGNVVSTITVPGASGYQFGGFYTGKAGSGTKVIDENGNVLAAAKTQIATSGETATWYAKWTQTAPSTYTVTYNCGTGTGTAPSSVSNISSGASFTPANNTCTKTGYEFIGWAVSNTTNDIKRIGTPFTWNYTENKTFTAQWAKVLVEASVLSGGTLSFDLGAIGNFTVICGDGGTLSGTGVSGNTITRSSTTTSTYTCTYSNSGVKYIGFDGLATGYGTYSAGGSYNTFNLPASITGVWGRLGAIFPTLSSVGSGTSLQPVFRDTFKNSGITYIESDLFSGITGTPVQGMFMNTFQGSSINILPENLFSAITGNVSNSVFWGTFADCPNLTEYIPPSMFSGLVANGSPDAMYNPFRSSPSLATSCPSGMTQYFTGYESYWNSYVSCASNKVTYSCGDGTGTPPVNSGVVNGLYFRVSANTCSREGYNFAGWKVSGTNDIKSANGLFQWNYGAVDKTFTAQWSTTAHTITLDDNGGSGGNGAIYNEENVGVYLDDAHNNAMGTNSNPVNVPAKTDANSVYLAFLGYYTEASGGTQVINANGYVTSSGATWLAGRTSNTTIHAHWSTTCFARPLDNTTYCGGDGVPRIYYTANSNTGNITGWYSDATCSTLIGWGNTNTGLSSPPVDKTNATFLGYIAHRSSPNNTFTVINEDLTFASSLLVENTATKYMAQSNFTWYAVCGCDAGYQGSGHYVTMGGVNAWEGACTEGITVTLDDNNGSGGDGAVYTRKGNASTGGVFTDMGRTNAMTTSTNCITAPTRSNHAFKGYYSATTNGEQYTSAASNGNTCITSLGLQTGRGYGASDVGATWYAQWEALTVTCPSGTYLPANSTSTSDCTQCTAGNYCPGGDYDKNYGSNQGITACPSKPSNFATLFPYEGNTAPNVTSPDGASAVTQCYIAWLPQNCVASFNDPFASNTTRSSGNVVLYAKSDSTWPTGSDRYDYVVPAALYAKAGYGITGGSTYLDSNNASQTFTDPQITAHPTGKRMFGIVGKKCEVCTGSNYSVGSGRVRWNSGGFTEFGACNACPTNWPVLTSGGVNVNCYAGITMTGISEVQSSTITGRVVKSRTDPVTNTTKYYSITTGNETAATFNCLARKISDEIDRCELISPSQFNNSSVYPYTYSYWNVTGDTPHGSSNASGTTCTFTNNELHCTNKYNISAARTNGVNPMTMTLVGSVNTYTVTYNANGGDASSCTTSYTYGTGITTLCTPTKTAAAFQGWYNDGLFTDGPVTTITTSDFGDKTFFAKWNDNDCGAGTYVTDNGCASCPAGQYCTGGDAQPVTCAEDTYSTGGASTCSDCPSGLKTSSEALTVYHDEAGDCGRKLHVGTYTLWLRSSKKTTPSLNFDYGETRLYANMQESAANMSTNQNPSKKFKMNYTVNGVTKTYHVCDDTTYTP